VIRTPATAHEIERTWEIEVFSAFIILVVTLLSGFAGGQAAAQAQESIGAVSRIQGEASGTRGGATRALGLNASVFLNEVVSTGEAARLEVTFTDNTRLTLGEKAELTLDKYVFNPAAGSGTIKSGWLAPSGFSPARCRSWRALTSA
jgi:hypothetical protein